MGVTNSQPVDFGLRSNRWNEKMTIMLDGSGLTIEKVVRVAREGEKISLSASAKKRIVRCRRMVEEKA